MFSVLTCESGCTGQPWTVQQQTFTQRNRVRVLINQHPGENFCRKVTKVKDKAYLIIAGAWRGWHVRMASILPFFFLFLLALIVTFAVWLFPVWLLLVWLFPVWLLLVWLLLVWLLLVLTVRLLGIWLFAIFIIFLIPLKRQHTTEELVFVTGKPWNDSWMWGNDTLKYI